MQNALQCIAINVIIQAMPEQNNKELQIAISLGEGQQIEFKEGLSKIDRDMVALCNSTGGKIYVGISDQGKLTKKNIDNTIITRIFDIARNCDPQISIDLKKIHPYVLRVEVLEGSSKPYQCKDGFFLRKGSNSYKLNTSELKNIFNNNQPYYFDRQINTRFNYEKDLRQQSLNELKKRLSIGENYSQEDLLNILELGQYTNEGFKLNNAGVLFCSAQPERFITEAYITCVKYAGEDRFNVIDRAEITGNLFAQIEDAIKFIQKYNATSYHFNNSPKRKEISQYPDIAIREAVINAISHRDYYYQHSHIYIHLYSDRIEIDNPGGLMPGLTLQNLEKKSIRRNPLIADILYRAGYIEKLGTGFLKIRNYLQSNSNPQAEISASNFFNIRFTARSNTATQEELSKRQHSILELLYSKKDGINSAEFADMLKTSQSTISRDLKVLLSKKMLKKEGQGKLVRYFHI